MDGNLTSRGGFSEFQGWLVMLWVLCVFLLGGCASAPGTGSNMPIGVVDGQRVLEETQAGKKANASLNAFLKNRQELIQLEEKELKRMEENLLKQASVLSANARKDRENKFRQRMVQYQQKVAKLNREVQEKQREVFEEFRGRVETVAARVAQRLGLLLVVEKGKGGPTIYTDVSLDISDEVIQEFNRNGNK